MTDKYQEFKTEIGGREVIVEVGKYADLVMWSPAFFGIKPEMIIKCGMIAGSKMGDANASIPTPEPVYYREMFGHHGKAKFDVNITFVSKAAVEDGIKEKLNLERIVLPVKNCRNVTKKDMKNNDVVAHIDVNPETYEVKVDGKKVTSKAADKLSLAQLYNLF